MHWLVISSTLFDIHQEKCTGGAVYESPDKTLNIKLTQLGFVDDVVNRTNLPFSEPNPDQQLEQLISQASKDSQLWRDLLESSNQALELDKCKFQVIHYRFEDDGEPTLVTDPDPPHPLQVQDKDGNPVTIEHVPNHEPIKYLGFKKCCGSQAKQLTELTAKADNFGNVL